jgi:hypothetical protein
MPLKPWYKVVTPREDLRGGKPLDADESAFHLDDLRNDSAPPDCQHPNLIYRSMILFAAGRSGALKRFLVEAGASNDTRFWPLAQALSALYPSSTEEKRWVDGVLARKKGLGF